MKKKVYLLVAVILLLGLLPATAAAEEDIIMYVSDVTATVKPTNNGLIFIGLVTVEDEDGHPVQGAKVTATLTLTTYDGTSLTKTITAQTTPKGVATFRITGPARWFHVMVNDVVKKGYIYAPELNHETSAYLDLWT